MAVTLLALVLQLLATAITTDGNVLVTEPADCDCIFRILKNVTAPQLSVLLTVTDYCLLMFLIGSSHLFSYIVVTFLFFVTKAAFLDVRINN